MNNRTIARHRFNHESSNGTKRSIAGHSLCSLEALSKSSNPLQPVATLHLSNQAQRSSHLSLITDISCRSARYLLVFAASALIHMAAPIPQYKSYNPLMNSLVVGMVKLLPRRSTLERSGSPLGQYRTGWILNNV